ncbi:hypothetical protein [Tissierella sp.]|uniref:hypothetical protein n=1 Tax=Tissierella sp. TaxID=41274 RepID=UPI00285E4722|nr:hypothetical protein [Tissierella sp.]MDR7857224.1 hypothetical protein [Tissierella sp.]
MKIKEVKSVEISLFILAIVLSATTILNIATSYYRYSYSEDSLLVFFMFIIGTISGLIIRIGLASLFWCSYNIKYSNENYNQKILKKVVASFLFLIIMTAFSLNNGMLLIFIFCTLLMIVREQKKCLEYNKNK